MDAITVENKIANVNLNRCIGCGLCVTTCEKKAIKLYPTKKKTSPPRNSQIFYIQVLYKKYGFWKLLKMGLPYLYRKTI
jgi:Fe-S-cluster-containing hydrogenase component 2